MMPHPPPNGSQVIGVFVSRDLFKELQKRVDKSKRSVGFVAQDLILEGLEYQREKRRVKK